MAVEALFDAETKWVSETDPDLDGFFELRYPNAPNLGDLTEIDSPPPADIVTAGFPCQPFSQAGNQKGSSDDRHLWPHIADLVGRMDPPPRLLVLENVPRLLTIEGGDVMARVVYDLAQLGYVGSWRLLRASDVGACHRRNRWFCVAAHTERTQRRANVKGRQSQRRASAGRDSETATDTGSQRRRQNPRSPHGYEAADAGRSTSNDNGAGPQRLLPTPRTTDSNGPGVHGDGGLDLRTAVTLLPTPNTRDSTPPRPKEKWEAMRASGSGGGANVREYVAYLLPTPTALLPTPTATDAKGSRNATAGRSPDAKPSSGGWTLNDIRHADRFGEFQLAVDRHALIVGRLAPEPVDDGRLSERFVEWMMMLPEGWVTDLDISRRAKLRILGNGVVPAQAYAAVSNLPHPSF